jgi:hypothetical protein
VPLAHLSLELGHLYMEDFAAGPERLREHFARVRPWADAARAEAEAAVGGRRPRISTCFLIDDYFTRFSSPALVVPMLLAEADKAGLTIDYLARESACAVADGVALAEAVLHRLVEEPPPGSDGSRPPARETGWLSNGERAPGGALLEAMADSVGWLPPSETTARRHSVFLDVELYDDRGGRRTWSCPFLAAVWQLARMGLLRHCGDPVLQPGAPWTGDGFPQEWDELPALVQLNASAAPFSAYRTCTVLPTRFLPVEHAVQLLLGHVDADPVALAQVAERSAREGIPAPDEIPGRASYVFCPGI